MAFKTVLPSTSVMNAFHPNLRRTSGLLVSGLLACLSGLAQAENSLPGPASPVSLAAASPTSLAASRWQSSMAAFAAADREKPPAADGALFVGSSTIRMWTSLAQDFRQLPVVINRGFGGSTMADCEQLARELVTRYRPRQVLVYAGDNDLAEGRSPQQVLASFVNFVRVVRSELPLARIAYISIKPSPSRAHLLPRVQEANQLLAAYVGTLENAAYIDIFSPMLAADGRTRPELFKTDMLHMNDSGYALWQSVINTYLATTASAAAPALAKPADGAANPTPGSELQATSAAPAL